MIAIIAEYNPFHNGHIFQLDYAQKKFPGEKILIVMSGKYVQRGEMAISSFYSRKKIAKKYGANKVVKLPFEYATQAAHVFARGAVLTAIAHGADKLLFGSESNDVNNLIIIAKTMKEHFGLYNLNIKKYLKQGFSFPKSASLSLKEITSQEITLPNDILGLEYVKTIIFNDLKIIPFSMKRTIDFHSNEINGDFASATLIREMIKQKKDVSKYTPMNFNHKKIKLIENQYYKFQKIVIKTDRKDLAKIKLVSEGIENLFKKHIMIPSYIEFVKKTTSRRYTSSRIKRIMLYILLNIKK